MNLWRFAVAAALGAAFLLASCSGDDPLAGGGASDGADEGGTLAYCSEGSVLGMGSSAQANAMVAWVKEYQSRCADAVVTYDSVGSGAGIENFVAGVSDFGGSDSQLSHDDQPGADARCGTGPAIHLPMVVGPVAVAYNVGGIGELNLAPATIAKIFAGSATVWDDPAIAADNPDAALPPTPITTVHRSGGSGTTDNFTAFLAATAPDDWAFGADRDWPAPGGRGEPGNEGVSAAITSSDGAIGYVELSFAHSFHLDTARVVNGAGELVEVSDEAAGNAVAGAEITGTGNDLRLALDYRTTESGAYPIVLVTYELVCQRGNPPASLASLQGFLGYTSSREGQAVLTDIGYAPLPDGVRDRVAAAVASLG